MYSDLISRTLIGFIWLLCMVLKIQSSFIYFLQMTFSQHHLLKRLSLFHHNFVPLLKINFLYMWRCFCTLNFFHWLEAYSYYSTTLFKLLNFNHKIIYRKVQSWGVRSHTILFPRIILVIGDWELLTLIKFNIVGFIFENVVGIVIGTTFKSL